MSVDITDPPSIAEMRELLTRPGGWPIIDREVAFEVPYFGKVLHETRDVKGTPTDYWNLLRTFGWAVTFGVTVGKPVPYVITLIQWKPGINSFSWELPPGGIGKLAEDASPEQILAMTQDVYARETGFGRGNWKSLGHVVIESGKYRGATPESHGLRANLFLATSLEVVGMPQHASNEVITPIFWPLMEFREVLESGLFVEESAVPCAYRALVELSQLNWSQK